MNAELSNKELIYDTSSSTIYKGLLGTTGEEVIIKIAKGTDFSGIYNEYAMLSDEQVPLKTLAIQYIDNKPSLVRSYLPGKSLKDLIGQGSCGIDFFLKVAPSIAQALQQLHQRGIIHKDISPYNIIIDDKRRQATIIDFESSVTTQSSTVFHSLASSQIGNLYYVSPEQTGRMNRVLDYRTDYYSLGITCYEMLSGRLPFQSDDPMELVHCHIAKVPTRLDLLNPDIPEILADIVSKLIAKNAEDRYQSMAGLIADLQQCSNEWRSKKRLSKFSIATRDISTRLHVSQKVVGRDAALQTIQSLFAKAAEGQKVLLTVGGVSGVGKSTLIRESIKVLTQSQGIFINGKFDPLQRKIPYYAWIQAFEQFADILLAEPPEEVARLSSRYMEQLQGLENIITALVPKLRKILPESGPLPDLNARELQNRMQYVIGLFMAAIATPEHPVMLFLDDWQWADEDSIQLLESINNNPNLGNIMLVAAYRSNEVDTAHPFRLLLNAQEQQTAESSKGVLREAIQLEPLTSQHTRELLQNTLYESAGDLTVLSENVFQKTLGNPFLVKQLLGLLYDRKLLWLNSLTYQWEWDLPKIQAMGPADDVVLVILEKLNSVHPETLRVLTQASAISNTFSLIRTAAILKLTPAQLHRLLWPAIKETIIIPTRSDYKYLPDYYDSTESDVFFRFAHDRIQQTLYQTLSADEKEKLHYLIGSYLLEHDPDNHSVFETANHFLECEAYLKDSALRPYIAQALQVAGRQAYQSAAFETSYHYLRLWDTIRSQDAAEVLDSYLLLIQAGHLSGHIEEVLQYEEKAFSHCAGQEDRSRTYMTLITSYTATNQLHIAVDLTRKALSELGIHIPERANKLQVMYQAIRSRFILRDKDIATISEWSDMQDPKYQWAMRLLDVSLSAYFLSRFETYPLLIFKMVDLNVRYGNTREAITGFGSYGLILAGIMQAPESGYKVGKQALKLLEKYNARDLVARAGFVDSVFIAHWKESIVDMPEKCFGYYRAGLSQGDIWYAGWNLYMSNVYEFYVGNKLSVILDKLRSQLHFFQQHHLSNMAERTSLEIHLVSQMANRSDVAPVVFDLEQAFVNFRSGKDLTALFTAYSLLLVCDLWMGNYQEAWEQAEQAKHHTDSVKSVYSYHYFHVYQSVAALHNFKSGHQLKPKTVRSLVSRNLAFLKKLASMQPANYEWAFLLVQAEYATYAEDTFDKQAYSVAAESAQKNGMVFPALFIRLHMLRAMGDRQHAAYPEELEKIKAQLRWFDMNGVLRRLEAGTSAEVPDQKTAGETTLSRSSNYFSIGNFDSQTILKSIEVLTGELQLDKLLDRLMTFALENAGADYGCFLLLRDGRYEPVVERYADAPASSNEVGQVQVPASILNYVLQSESPLKLNDASGTEPYAADPMVQKNGERSVLCIPFVNKGKINGVIYLTNRLVSNAFTEERVGLLKVLAGQISLSIENALLYENMENLVDQRTKQLDEEKKKSDLLLLNILPAQVAEELKRYGEARPRHYEQVTIMFCDFKNFTSYAEKVSPELLIKDLDYYFRSFDAIIKRHHIEKIKTIGDAYLCVGGLPEANTTHPTNVLEAALELRQWIAEESEKRIARQEMFLGLRIGIHTGPVVAGVVGASKFAYDIWGDSVNTAARMEASGEVGKINISGATYELIKEGFSCQYRGKIPAKNKGEIDMYFVDPRDYTVS